MTRRRRRALEPVRDAARGGLVVPRDQDGNRSGSRPIGHWTTVKHSGAIPVDRKRELVERCERLLAAVKDARERANMIEVSDTPGTSGGHRRGTADHALD